MKKEHRNYYAIGLLSVLVAVAMISSLAIVPGTVNEEKSYTTGALVIGPPGTYEINDEADLRDLATYVNAGNATQDYIFELTNDIVLTNPNWDPIGNPTYPFEGTFDGKGHTIGNLKALNFGFYLISPTEVLGCAGLFGYVGALGMVENINMADTCTPLISSTGAAAVYLYAGMVVGFNEGKVLNCSNAGTLRIEYEYTGAVNNVEQFMIAGGVVGGNGAGAGDVGIVKDCINTGTVIVISDGKNSHDIQSIAGGVVGANGWISWDEGIVEGCANFGTAGARATALNNVASTGAFARAGGIVGFNFGTILDGVNKGFVVAEAEVANNYVYVGGDDVPRAEAYSGGISGTNWEGSLVKRCHNGGEVNGRTLPVSLPGCWSDGFLYVGGISGLSFAAIEDCSNAGVINAEGKNDTHVLAAGGIVGCMDHVDAITVNCYNAGSVTADQRASGAYGWIDGVGGIAGHVFDGNIFNCYNKGNLALTSNSGFLDVGGIIGSMWPDGFADACYWYVGAVQTAGVFPMPLGVGYVGNTLGAVTISFDNTELEDLLGWLNGYVETYAPTTLSGWVIIPGLNNDFPIFGNIVTFDPDNGDPEWDVSVGYGGIVDEPSPEPTKYGYDFLGWFTVSDDQWDFDDPVFNDMTLTAKWQPVQWTVTFDPDNGELSFYETVDHGSSVTEPSDPTKTGYIFFGWFTFFDDKWNFSDPVGSSMTLKAKWIIDSGAWATVTFDSNGGSAVAAVDVIKGDTITAPTAPTKATYIFGGWYSDIALTTAFTFTTPISGDMTLYAKWNYDPADWATVTFDSLGGSAVPAEYVLKGGTATEPAAPTKDWWVFEWWCTDPECEEDYTWDPVDADITLYAKWRRGNEGWAVVTFESNGGSDVPEQYVLQGDLCTKPGDPYKLGWELDAWYSDEGLTVEFDFDTPVDGDITLYAKWSINPEAWATVTFVSNGGTPVPSASVLKGELVPRPASPTRASFTFDKWYTDEAFEQEFSFDTPVDSDLTLYAKYTPVPVVVAEEGGFNWLLLLIPLALLLILFLLWMRPSVYGTITYNGEGVSDVTIEYTIKKKNSEETISKQAVNKKSGKYRIIVSMGAEFTFTVIAKDGHTVSEIPATFVIEKRSTEVNFTVK